MRRPRDSDRKRERSSKRRAQARAEKAAKAERRKATEPERRERAEKRRAAEAERRAIAAAMHLHPVYRPEFALPAEALSAPARHRSVAAPMGGHLGMLLALATLCAYPPGSRDDGEPT